MEQIVLVAHLIIALAIIGLIMLQQGKGADMGASFGAGASQTLLGSDGSGNVLTRSTTWLAALFFATSFGLAIIATGKSAAVNELDLDIPVTVESEFQIEESEFPVIEADIPQAASSTTDQDVPEL
ncbi:MAG: preprotein translocase subunit SecG [Halioglobus sp.]|jgi:preprotein translocase subunit SecG